MCFTKSESLWKKELWSLGVLDIIDGFTIRDIKTKYSEPNDSDYINSAQWKFYMEMFGADTFHFDLFVFDGYKKEKAWNGRKRTTSYKVQSSNYLLLLQRNVRRQPQIGERIYQWAKYREVFDLLPEYTETTINNLH